MKPTLQELYASLPEQVVHHIQHLERIRQDFIANISHELRTPLTVIHGYLELLLDQVQDEKNKKIFFQMQQQTLRMENLIDNLLLLSRLESDEDEETFDHETPIATMLQRICDEANALSGDAQHQIHLEADETLNLLGREEELYSLFSNIIFNAVKYTPAHGSIHISWYRKEGRGIFRVEDTGIGIAPEHIPRVTERFYRIDPARSRTSGGTGIGLAIVKHVLIRLHGQLEIVSEVGKGSVFICSFPQEVLNGLQ